MTRLGAAHRRLVLTAFTAVVSIVQVGFATGASYYPTAIMLDELRTQSGESQFRFAMLTWPWSGHFINPLGEDTYHSPFEVYGSWDKVAERLFGDWSFITNANSKREVYKFSVSSFEYGSIAIPFPQLSLPEGARVTSPFVVTVSDGDISGPLQSQNVEDLKTRWLGDAGFWYEFGKVGENPSIVITTGQQATSFNQHVSVITPSSPNAMFDLRVNLTMTRRVATTVIPVNVPESNGLAIASTAFAAAACTRRASLTLRGPRRP